MKLKIGLIALFLTLAFSLSFSSCDLWDDFVDWWNEDSSNNDNNENNGGNGGTKNRTYADSVKKAEFTGDTVTITFENLDGNDIFLVKINNSENNVAAADTGGTLLNFPPNQSTMNTGARNLIGTEYFPEEDFFGHPDIEKLMANPPPRLPTVMSESQAAFVPPTVGTQRQFWIAEGFDFVDVNFLQIPATLLATGKHGNIWVNDNSITTPQAELLSARFDIIYPATTNLLGYEYGGGPGGDGGIDGDPKIQILVYHLLNKDGSESSILGYFNSVDYYRQTQIDQWAGHPNGTAWIGYKSNEAEIFYINSRIIASSPDRIATTLIHELQHMIHHNVKRVQHGLTTTSWYNEMLSIMAQETISHLINVTDTNSGHQIRARTPAFLARYDEFSFTQWEPNGGYAAQFIHGAYLFRNFGGAELLKNIMANNFVGTKSISEALNEKNPGMNYEKALSRFGEAMVFSGNSKPEGVLTLDKTVTSQVTGFTYIGYGFDLWNMNRSGANIRGPVVFDLTPMNMLGHSVLLQSSSEWKNRSGKFSVTLTKPNNPGIELYLMVR